MGAEFQSLEVDGSFDQVLVQKAFSEAQAEDLHQNGHSNSGGIGMACGLEFKDNAIIKPFQNIGLARMWLQDHAAKWEAALAVRYLDKYGKERWLIGAWCAS